MIKGFRIFGLEIALVSLLILVVFLWPKGANTEDPIVNDQRLPQVVKAVDLNKRFTFAGELIPNDFDARERLDRELLVNSYWQSNTMLNIKSANRYFPVIEKILKEENVPDDFKFLAVAESNLRNVVSPAKAVGFWQIRKLAAKEAGLEVNSEVDERYHVEKATRAAARYLKQLKNRFGTWIDAAAAYNVGPTNYSKIRRAQGEDSYFDLNLNQETSRYVFRLVAIKEVLSTPTNFGFYLELTELYPPLDNYYEVKVDSTVNSWKSFASEHGITYRELKVYNPWLRDNKLTVKNNKYRVRIPRS